jgi:hypothetical protein
MHFFFFAFLLMQANLFEFTLLAPPLHPATIQRARKGLGVLGGALAAASAPQEVHLPCYLCIYFF